MRMRLVLMATLGLLCGCSASGTAAAPPAGWIGRNGGLSHGAEALRVKTVADRFSRAVQYPFSVNILENDSPTAFAWPSGDVFLTSGLVRLLDDQEIAAVIAHELGHLIADSHIPSAVALVGAHDHGQAEFLADEQGLKILRSTLTPPDALRTALQKVLSYHELRGSPSPQLAARIARLP